MTREELLRRVRELQLEQLRIGWCDTHGLLRGKTLVLGPGADGLAALEAALDSGIGLVGTSLLKDSGDRTAYPVFEPAMQTLMPGFEGAATLVLRPDPASFTTLPWAARTGWLRAQPEFAGGAPVPLDTRRILQSALARLSEAGWRLRCGLELEFHIWRIVDTDAQLDPLQAAWPGEPPRLAMLHPGYQLLGEAHADMAHDALAIVRSTALGLGLPLRSLEIELGPSQFEAVFAVQEALAAADSAVLFRNGVKQALRRAGYHASFVCRPPFPNVMASGWHLHQSLTDEAGRNAFMKPSADPEAGDAQNGPTGDALRILSPVGAHWLAGLLAHARGAAAFANPSINGYARFRPGALAPVGVHWGRDNRGAMLRVLGGAGDAGTRIENRCGEPLANPYLYLAAQVASGLDGVQRQLVPPPATEAPYSAPGAGAPAATMLPLSLADALDALAADEALRGFLGAVVCDWYTRLKRQELARHAAAEDPAAWEQREYLSRY